MKILTSIVVAGALAAAGVAGTTSAASAGGWYHHGPNHRPHVVYRSSPDAGGALVAGAILGLAFGAIASNAFAAPAPEPEPVYLAPPHPNYAAADGHYGWCAQTYRSYNGETDTFIDFQGIARRCVAPFD